MKRGIPFLSFIIFSICSSAQNAGKIQHNYFPPGKLGIAEFIYSPPRNLSFPEDLFASIVYRIGEEYYLIKKPMTKSNGKYSFTFSPPDTVKALILTITDVKQRTIDNNRDSGYTILCNKVPEETASSKVEAAYLLSYYAPAALQLDMSVPPLKMVALYEEAYKLAPDLKQDITTYRYFLYLQHQQKGKATKPGLLTYVKKMEAQNDETSMATALYIYRFLQMDSAMQEIESRSIRKFPKGEVARQKFVNDFYDKKGKTEQSILKDIDEYIQRFGDTSSQMKYTFYMAIIEWLLAKKRYDPIPVYETIVGNNLNLAYIYNGEAGNLIEEYIIDSSVEHLLNARRIIIRSMQITAAKIQAYHTNPEDLSLQKANNKFKETFAQILFLQKQFDSAFHYQSQVVNHSIDPKSAPTSASKLINYASKLKGDQFARDLLIEQLNAGNYSPELMKQFKEINGRLGINNSTDKYASWSTSEFAMKKKTEAIKKRFGSQQFRNFSLSDLSGKTVTLSSFKNKVIVLDFWASWCAPCLASFPHMREVVEKYQKDSSVVFLFINTAEQVSLERMKATATRIMRDNEYDFLVLLDDKKKAGIAYKVNFIPETFVIDRKGNIVFMGNDNSTIEIEIENAKK